MSESLVFTVANAIAAVSWILLVVFPGFQLTRYVVRSGLVVLLLALGYSVVIAISLSQAEAGGFGSLDEVRELFEQPWALVAGWLHYLAFDLLAGIWIKKDAERVAIPHVYLIIPLFFTFMFGPFGLALYYILKRFWLKSLSHEVFG